MEKAIAEQYNRFAKQFVQGTDIYNGPSRDAYYALLDFDMNGKRILDVGCGDGHDLELLQKMGAAVYGVDASSDLGEIARQRLPEAEIQIGLMENLPYEDRFFDVVLSKYALQTSANVVCVLHEMARVLKVGGTMVYLTVHPLRQFLEKRKHPKDYFLQEVVASIFFGGTVTAKEPTHTLNEYFNPEFLRKFRITHFSEQGDFPSTEKVDGDSYPCFFVLRAEKLMENFAQFKNL